MDGVDEGLYGGDEPKPNQAPPKSIDEQEAEAPTALIPKSLLAGKKFNPGDEVVLQIVAEHGEEVEVKYAPEKPEEDETKPETETSTDPELASMNSEY
jgi:hypothetical protein